MKMIISLLLMGFVFMPGKVTNADRPLKGDWDLQMKQVWALEEAGEDILSIVTQIAVDENGTVFLVDRKNRKFYVFSAEGTFLRSFGKRGEGPGEIKQIAQSRLFLVDDKIIATDIDRLHYFTKEGKYIRAVVNPLNQKRPVHFYNGNEFVSAPLLRIDAGEGEASIRLHNIRDNSDRVIAPFSVFEGGVAQQGGSLVALVIGGVSPMPVLGFHENLILHGMNDNYRIQINDREGKLINDFSLDRAKKKIKDGAISRVLKEAMVQVPEDMLARIVQSLPKTETYFGRISIHNDLIFVQVDYLGAKNPRQIDIFSLDGTYLYRAFARMEEGFLIRSSLLIHGNHMYFVRWDEDGETSVVKCSVSLPKE